MTRAAAETLFMPLCREPFDAFWDGRKTAEVRQLGKRWNEASIRQGRPVLLRLGYSGPREIAGLVGQVIND